jgi:hypothetical protein
MDSFQRLESAVNRSVRLNKLESNKRHVNASGRESEERNKVGVNKRRQRRERQLNAELGSEFLEFRLKRRPTSEAHGVSPNTNFFRLVGLVSR